MRAGLGLTLPTHLQLPQVPGPGEGAGAAAPALQQERLLLDGKGTGQPQPGLQLDLCSGVGGGLTQEQGLNPQRMAEASPMQKSPSQRPAARAGQSPVGRLDLSQTRRVQVHLEPHGAL